MSNPFSNWTDADVAAHNARHETIRGQCGEVMELRIAVESRESDLHAKIFDECRRRGWIALHGSMSERSHRTLGEWDFTVVADNGRVFFVEAKTASGKLSAEQQALIAWAKKLGHCVHVVRSFTEFLNLL